MNATRVRQVGQAMTALSAVIIAYATLTVGNLPAAGSYDKAAHFLLFLPLGIGGALWLAGRSAPAQRRGRAIILTVILVFAAATEVGQGFLETRDGSFADFVADAAGAGLGVFLGGLVAGRSRRDDQRRG